MGNRAVIEFDGTGIGLYLHWNGGEPSILGFLDAARIAGIRRPDQDSYGIARFTQLVSNWMGGTLSVGLATLDKCDCDNWDNGVYVVGGNWEILRRYGKGSENTEPDKDGVKRKSICVEVIECSKKSLFKDLEGPSDPVAGPMLEALETLRNDCEAMLDDDEDILGSMSLGQYFRGMLLNTINPAIAKATGGAA
jgi:hypothetical protein